MVMIDVLHSLFCTLLLQGVTIVKTINVSETLPHVNLALSTFLHFMYQFWVN